MELKEWPKKYSPREHEANIYQQWEAADAFKPNGGKSLNRQDKKPFVIMLPLPNVTGSLHMGHALQHTLIDTLIRYHRMKGEPTLWQPGTDHAGIATQNVVEKSLREQGLTRHDLGREKFLGKVWEWREKYGGQIVAQMKRLGASCDWSRLVFTMDEKYVQAVHTAFSRYYERGFIYRGSRIVNWCPRCASVISDLEIKHEDRAAELYTLRYPLIGRKGVIEVATTRPETMLGDVAVAVNPADKRWEKLVGRKVLLPLVKREIPIVTDERIDQEFGTGAVKITPAHDPLDALIGQEHQLPVINVIGEDGMLTAQAGKFAGLPVGQARQEVIRALQEENVLAGTQSYNQSVALCDRCGTVIEPLVSKQWFVDMDKLKNETIKVAREGLVEFYPPRWKKNFLDWMDNVNDWTISRQLWWGQRIPVWWKKGTHGSEDEEGNYVVAIDKPAQGEWEQDPDVFDTWFSSALWPLATLGWPGNTQDLKTFYPTSVLISGRDILYLWIARMIFSGLELLKGEEYGNLQTTGRIPFEQVFIHPTVLTKTGRRMSKSLGTGVDPLTLIDKYGADATRFGLVYQMFYDNQAIKFDEEAVKSARNFANKLWNIARLLSLLPDREVEPTIADRWIAQRWRQTAEQVSQCLDRYKAGEAARALYDFIWRDYADWYGEIIKVEGSTAVAREIFNGSLKLLHPFMPFVTELIWSLGGNKSLLIKTNWPEGSEVETDRGDLAEMERFQDVVTTIRGIKTLLNMPAAATLELFLPTGVIMAEALAKVAKVKILTEKNGEMRQWPLKTGGVVYIGAREITSERIKMACQKLEVDRAQIAARVERQERNLEMMRGKAPQEVVENKEQELAATKLRWEEIEHGVGLLQ